MRSSAGLAEIETSRLRCPGALENLPGRSEFAGLFGAPRRLRHRPALRATRFFRVCPPVSARCLPPQLGVDLVEVDLALGRADRGIGPRSTAWDVSSAARTRAMPSLNASVAKIVL